MGRRPTTIVYVDGFNFYYAAFKNGPHGDCRWLDLESFFDRILPKNDVVLVRYFTARVKPVAWDPDQAKRQAAYLAALGTLSRVTVIEGTFKIRKEAKRLVRPSGQKKRALVWDQEEKGSDVNLATYLVRDGFKGMYDVAVVVSDDSDLLEAVRIVRSELSKPVGIIKVRKRRSVFRNDGDFFITPRRDDFKTCQFPAAVSGADGKQVASCPLDWQRSGP